MLVGKDREELTLQLLSPTGQRVAPWSVNPPNIHTSWGCTCGGVGAWHLSHNSNAPGQEGRRGPCEYEEGAYLGHAALVVKTVLDQALIL